MLKSINITTLAAMKRIKQYIKRQKCLKKFNVNQKKNLEM